jgi:hypothetical protein
VPQATAVALHAQLDAARFPVVRLFGTGLDAEIWRIRVTANNEKSRFTRHVLFAHGKSDERRVLDGVIVLAAGSEVRARQRRVGEFGKTRGFEFDNATLDGVEGVCGGCEKGAGLFC